MEIYKKLGKFQIAAAMLRNISNRTPENSGFLQFNIETISKIRQKYRNIKSIIKDRKVKLYREFYWKLLGLDPTKVRPANEALLRRVVLGNGLPKVSLVVDAYNLASVHTMFPMCAYDSDSIEGDSLYTRFSNKNEVFSGIGFTQPLKLTGNEVTIHDAIGPISIYPYRDCERTKVTESSRNILLTVCGVPGISGLELLWALKVCLIFISKFSGGTCEFIL